MSLAYIRRYYNVPAKRGMVIKYRGVDVVIVGSNRSGSGLRVRNVVSGRRYTYSIHPTWEVEYPQPEGGA